MKVRDEFKPLVYCGIGAIVVFLLIMAIASSTKTKPCKVYRATVESIERNLGGDGYVVKVRVENFANQEEKLLNVWAPSSCPDLGALVHIAPRGSKRRPSSAKSYDYVIAAGTVVQQRLRDGSYVNGN